MAAMVGAVFWAGNAHGWLATQGTKIVQASTGQEVHLACVNWYGLDQLDYVMGGLQFTTPSAIAKLIADYGFNCVRVPLSVQAVLTGTIVAPYAVTAYPPLNGSTTLTALYVRQEGGNKRFAAMGVLWDRPGGKEGGCAGT